MTWPGTRLAVRPEPVLRAIEGGNRRAGGQPAPGTETNARNDILRPKMPFWVYILRCSDDSYYTGHTDGLERRIAQHETGDIPGYTSGRLPVTLVYAQEFTTREEALGAETQVKGWSLAKKEALMRGDWEGLSALAVHRTPDAPR